MRPRLESEQRRASLGLGVLVGVFLAFPAAALLLPALGVTGGCIALGPVVGAPVFLLLSGSIGTFRALLLVLLTAVAAATLFAVLALGARVATGCVG